MFSQLLSINGEFIFSYTSSGLYILDPTNASVILWSEDIANISEAHVVNDEIYIMTKSGQFHCLTLSLVDSLIVTLYDRKLYQDCLQTCTTFRSKMLKSLVEKNSNPESQASTSDHLDIKSVKVDSNSDDFYLKSDHQDLKISEILPLIDFLRTTLNKPKKLDCGIVVVNAGISKNSLEPFGSGTLEEILKSTRDEENFMNDDGITNGNIIEQRKKREEKQEKNKRSKLNVHEAMYNLQTELEPLHVLVESLQSSVEEEKIEVVLLKVSEMIKYIKRR